MLSQGNSYAVSLPWLSGILQRKYLPTYSFVLFQKYSKWIPPRLRNNKFAITTFFNFIAQIAKTYYFMNDFMKLTLNVIVASYRKHWKDQRINDNSTEFEKAHPDDNSIDHTFLSLKTILEDFNYHLS